MFSLRTSSPRAAWLCATLLGLLLALRVLSPAGFMPAFEQGSVTIVACPDGSYEPPTTMAMHHHQRSKHHEQCPYASASAFGTLAAEFTGLVESLVLVGPLLLGRTYGFIVNHSRELRPPLRGPPLTA